MEAVEGFEGTHSPTSNVIRWEGGSVPDGVEAEFPVTVILPSTPGVVLFPTIQETEAGEVAWIDPRTKERKREPPPLPG